MSSTPDRSHLQRISSLSRRRGALVRDIAAREDSNKTDRAALAQVNREIALLLAELGLADEVKP